MALDLLDNNGNSRKVIVRCDKQVHQITAKSH